MYVRSLEQSNGKKAVVGHRWSAALSIPRQAEWSLDCWIPLGSCWDPAIPTAGAAEATTNKTRSKLRSRTQIPHPKKTRTPVVWPTGAARGLRLWAVDNERQRAGAILKQFECSHGSNKPKSLNPSNAL